MPDKSALKRPKQKKVPQNTANDLIGHYEKRALDDKNRVFIPKAFQRADLGRAFVLVADPEQACVVAYYKDAPIFTPETSRLIAPFAHVANIDSSGRITISEDLRKHAQLTQRNGISLIGCDSYVELWSPPKWKSEQEAKYERAREAMIPELQAIKNRMSYVPGVRPPTTAP